MTKADRKSPVANKESSQVGPGLYQLETPLIIKHNAMKGAYFVYEKGKLTKRAQPFSLQAEQRRQPHG